MRRKWILRLGLIAVLGAVGFVAYLWITTPRLDLSREKLARLTLEMDEEAICAIIGGPPTAREVVFDAKDRNGVNVEVVAIDPFIPERSGVTWRQWNSYPKALAIGFTNGKAYTILYFDLTETLWEKVKRRLRI